MLYVDYCKGKSGNPTLFISPLLILNLKLSGQLNKTTRKTTRHALNSLYAYIQLDYTKTYNKLRQNPLHVDVSKIEYKSINHHFKVLQEFRKNQFNS